jgi:uncharacterized membrane protein
MQTEWDGALERWQAAGLIDASVAERIRSFEQARGGPPRLRWPVIVALIFGGLMLAAGLLLFVAAHWDELSPAARFTLVLAMVAAFHTAGALAAARHENLAITLHGLGTAALGAGIFLAGQIFNLQAHWPSGAMLWAAGAWAGWALRRDWLQFAFAALLTPSWLAGEWVENFPAFTQEPGRVLAEGLLMLAITYFAATTRDRDDATRTVLVWIGGALFLPCAAFLALEPEWWQTSGTGASGAAIAAGYAAAFGLPLALAFWLRGREVWINLIAAAWVVLLGVIARTENPELYLWCALGASGMVAWGVREGRGERVNIGIAGFALTLAFFYFSRVMDKLGRSASLIGLGLLFLAGGWALERLRRRLIVRTRHTA